MRSLAVAVVFILGTVVTGCGSGAVGSVEGSGDRTACPQSGGGPWNWWRLRRPPPRRCAATPTARTRPNTGRAEDRMSFRTAIRTDTNEGANLREPPTGEVRGTPCSTHSGEWTLLLQTS